MRGVRELGPVKNVTRGEGGRGRVVAPCCCYKLKLGPKGMEAWWEKWG